MTAHSVSGKKRTPPRARHGLPGSRASLGRHDLPYPGASARVGGRSGHL